MENRSQYDDERVKKLPAPRRDFCTCASHGKPLAKKFTDESYSNLACYCTDPPAHSQCQCSTPAWGESLIATFVGEEYATNPATFDDSKRERHCKVGRYLHCVVRSTANKTDPSIPSSCTLRDYEYKVFQSKWETPLDLRVQGWQLGLFFAGRTRLVQRDFLRRHLALQKRTQSDTADYDQRDYPDENASTPILLEAAPGGLLYQILGMPATAWRATWQTIHALILLGLATKDTDAYNWIEHEGWPDHNTRTNLRSRYMRGHNYIEERDAEIDWNLAREEVKSVRLLFEREGLRPVIRWLITDPKDREEFLETFDEDLGFEADDAELDPSDRLEGDRK